MEEVGFVCTANECGQKTFSDDKQLISHKRKHDMVLSLNKPSHFSSDETPTPTRFIRNCEAIGLFQDLQNVNPFDETFKKAAEAVKKGEFIRTLNIPTLGIAAGEDLHTPHIDLTVETQSSNDGNDDNVEIVVRTEADTSLRPRTFLSEKSTLPISEFYYEKEKTKSAEQDLRLFVKIPDGSLVQIPTIGAIGGQLGIVSNQASSNATPRTIIISTQNTHSEVLSTSMIAPKPNHAPKILPLNNTASAAVKQKLKAALLKSTKASARKEVVPTPSTLPIDRSTEAHQTEARKEKRVTSTTVEEDHERKLKTLERNRVAAMKCRERRKMWVADLRQKYDKMCNTNDALVKEVMFLRNEVVRLKSALLLACNPPHSVEDVTATCVQIVPEITHEKTLGRVERSSSSRIPVMVEPAAVLSTSGRGARGGLRLDIEGAAKVTVMDLDSPLVRSDEILSSAGPPTTPNEKLISFPELDRVDGDALEEKMLSSVIQINPNALSKLPPAFS